MIGDYGSRIFIFDIEDNPEYEEYNIADIFGINNNYFAGKGFVCLNTLIEKINKCKETEYSAFNDENCNERKNWGCRKCNNGYFKNGNDIPCISCNSIKYCNRCSNYAGCISCNSGKRKKWNKNFGYNICE